MARNDAVTADRINVAAAATHPAATIPTDQRLGGHPTESAVNNSVDGPAGGLTPLSLPARLFRPHDGRRRRRRQSDRRQQNGDTHSGRLTTIDASIIPLGKSGAAGRLEGRPSGHVHSICEFACRKQVSSSANQLASVSTTPLAISSVRSTHSILSTIFPPISESRL